MRRQDSVCMICEVEFKFSELHEDHDDGPRHYEVWLHYFHQRNDDFCEVCKIVPNCPGDEHNNADRHKKNLLTLPRHALEERITLPSDSGFDREPQTAAGGNPFTNNIFGNSFSLSVGAMSYRFSHSLYAPLVDEDESPASLPSALPDQAAENLMVLQACVEDPVLILPVRDVSCDKTNAWFADTGATRSATFSIEGLYQMTSCRVRITGVGGGFNVTTTGLLDIPVLLDDGQVDTITISVLVDGHFPLQLLCLRDLKMFLLG